MKNFILICSTILFSLSLSAQSGNQNYVKSKIYKVETATTISNPTTTQASQTVNYFDGFGRLVQQVQGGGSGINTDLVTHLEYDNLGRQSKEYVPYAASSSDLSFRQNALTETLAFYSSFREGTGNPFIEKEFEKSLQNRVLKQSAPGDPWALGQGHELRFDYDTNDANDQVNLFSAVATWNPTQKKYDISFSANGTTPYPPGQLSKTVTRDENWSQAIDPDHSVEEFKDKERKIILKRAYDDGIAHDTYYVYDQYGNLTYVLPPKVNASSLSSQLDGLCYQYIYDDENRVVEKKLPGKQWEFTVYDRLDRVVAKGPALSPFTDQLDQQGWLITKYDRLDRQILTGWLSGETSSSSRLQMQNAYNTDTVYSETKVGGSGSGPAGIYSNNARPTSGYQLLTVSYFDDYGFPKAPITFPDVLSDQSQEVYYDQSLKPKGMSTGTWTRVPETSLASRGEVTTFLYDKWAHTVAEWKENYLGGINKKEFKIDFSGKLLLKETSHQRLYTTTPVLFTRETFSFNSQDRLVSHMHQIGQSGTPQLISFNRYDALGILISKSVGGTNPSGTNRLQQIDYEYNVRGWLTDINSDIDCDRCTNDDLFSFKIKYNDPGNLHSDVRPLFNGNISETYWKGMESPVWRKYGYVYDNLNRLVNSHYQKVNETIPNGNYDEGLTYDKNGNIITIFRNGDIDAAYQPIEIDDLWFSYDVNSNRLIDVKDLSNNPSGFSDEGDSSTADYLYDGNGNMTKDANKGISRIYYNHLNLPIRIEFSNGNKIFYRYNASGSKVMKQIVTSSATTTVDYLDGVQYKDSKLEFFPHSEGYVRNTYVNSAENYNYVFQYLDHLGNVRMNFALDPATNQVKILEENHYYPFGLKHANYSMGRNDFREQDQSVVLKAPGGPPPINLYLPLDYNYKYQGQEWQDELGLGWYSFKWRNYDPAIGRFVALDPLASKYPYNSPYAVQENKMGMGRELEGLELVEIGMFSQTGMSTPLLGTSETITTEAGLPEMSIELETVPVSTSSPSLGFFERIGNFFENMWDSMTGGSKDIKVDENVESGQSTPKSESGKPYSPNEPLRKGPNGEPKPDAEASGTDHTQLGRKASRKGGDYTQGREFNKDNKPVRDVDHTDHGRPNEHTDPHQHDWEPNPTGGTPKRGAAKPLEIK